MNIVILLFTFYFNFLFSQNNNCHVVDNQNLRSFYNIGDTLSVEDQNIIFPICNGSGEYSTGDSFSFSDLNGNNNGNDYKITLISMNATWWPACYDYISLMDQLIEVIEEFDELQFLVSLDYSSTEADLYSCSEWADLYVELGEFDNNPLILNNDPNHDIWNMFAGSTYSAYAFIDHNMVLRYKFDMPNLYDFQYTYIPILIDAMYGCTEPEACNYDIAAVYDDGSCTSGDDCDFCQDALNQLDCIYIEDCMWMGDHCMESNDNCMDFDNESDCMASDSCYWMGDHCMLGSNCIDPIAFNYNPIADMLGQGDNSSCQYSSFIDFGCTYEDAINFDEIANVDDGSCEYLFGDTNKDGMINILDIIEIVNVIMDMLQGN